MTNFLGTSFKDSAPVEETIFSSSNLIPGSDTASEPVAIIIFFATIFSILFSFDLIDISFSLVIDPVPLK